MYFLVFIVLLISILGLYTEIYTLQAAKIFSNQKAIAQIMRTWHGAAYTLARSHPTIGVTANGCSLTQASYTFIVPALCTDATGTVYLRQSDLPDYSIAEYTWKSVVYTSGTSRYLVTFVTPPVAGSLAAPIDGPVLGYTIGDIYQQLRNASASQISYGSVVAGKLVTRALDGNGTSIKYDLPTPTATIVPDGSVGIVSAL